MAEFRTISIVGLGKLGAPLAAALAHAGHRVIGVDLNPEFVSLINAGAAPVSEPGLQACIEATDGRLTATTDVAEAVAESDLTMIIVPTPSGPDHRFSNDYVRAALETIGTALKGKQGRHVVVVCSTVMPGSMDGELRAALEAASDKRVGGAELGFCYNPEFIALGSVIRDLTHPDFILIGESDPESGALLASVHDTLCENEPAHMRMSFVNAELCKISVNAFVTMKISFANQLAELCERTPGANVDVVTGAVGRDARIGGKYLKGALGFGGPCFPRDNKAFAACGESVGVEAALARATDAVNARQLTRLVEHVRAHAPAGGRVAVLGLSYKPETGEIEESPGVALCVALASEDYDVAAHDPAAGPAAQAALPDAVAFEEDLTAALTGADVVIVTTPWPAYRRVPDALKAAGVGNAVLLDPWRLFAAADLAGVATLVPLGKAPEPAA